MNTNHIKRFAQEARLKLIEQVASKMEYVLTSDSSELREKASQVRKLQEAINTSSKEQVIDRVAYTWFNRLMALRFMDANDYQPIGIRVLTPKEGYTLPELLDEAKQGNIPDELPINQKHVYDVLDGKVPSTNAQNEAYKELLIGACNHLNKVFPFLFEKLSDYTELLLPDDLISEFSIVQDIREGMTTEDCQEVEIIGWIYQFYISKKKDEVFASKGKVKKEDIPAATQLFTPRWIVEYMVQNTVGKLWLQNKPNSKLREHMPYFIESPSVESKDYLKVNSVEDITLLDQACGSGHILVYGFELLTKIYEEEGYNPSEIPQLIIEKNLFGFEIDERAAQLAGMALLMKARSYQRRVFKKELKPNILCYQDLKLTTDEFKEAFRGIGTDLSDELLLDLKNLQQATNLGSLIIPHTSLNELEKVAEIIQSKRNTNDAFLAYQLKQLTFALNQLILLSRKYHCVVDNPPYIGNRRMNSGLSEFVKKEYPMSKADVMACFIESGMNSLLNNGLLGMINQHSWMFLQSFKKLRKYILEELQIDSLLHLGPHAFQEISGELVQSVSFTLVNKAPSNKAIFCDLTHFQDTASKKLNFGNDSTRYIHNQRIFLKLSEYPIAYSASESIIKLFETGEKLSSIAKPRQGMATANNARFLREWFEVEFNKLNLNCNSRPESKESGKVWFPYNKGGSFRKWFGNRNVVLNWYDDGREVKNFVSSQPWAKKLFNPVTGVIKNQDFYFKEGLTWSFIGSKHLGIRYTPSGAIFDIGGSSLFAEEDDLHYFLGLLTSKLVFVFLRNINPTLNFQSGSIGLIPIHNMDINKREIKQLVVENIEISEIENNSKENSWDFLKHELLRINGQSIEESYELYQHFWNKKYFQLHKNEEQLNSQFIDIYDLQDELNPSVLLEDITILKEETIIANGQLEFQADEVFQQFMSYAVGCMFGRYSLDKEGLILANQGDTLKDYFTKVGKSQDEVSFLPDDDNIIPTLDDEWFEDDIVNRFNEFLKVSFGKADFEKNLAFVEECLGKDIRKYFVRDFYPDHIKRYKKRPIYWLFSSPKGAFNVLIYMQRYTPDTLNRILNDYLIEYREKLNTRKEHLDHLIETGSSSEQTKASKEKDKLKLVLLELQEYEREVLYPLATERIAIDLDDGVLVNYNKFGSAIKLVKGLNDKKAKDKVKGFDWIDVSEIR